MNKTLLLVVLSANFLVSPHSNADAICNDGWQSTSEGSGTCSWHGGVSQWYPDGTFDAVLQYPGSAIDSDSVQCPLPPSYVNGSCEGSSWQKLVCRMRLKDSKWCTKQCPFPPNYSQWSRSTGRCVGSTLSRYTCNQRLANPSWCIKTESTFDKVWNSIF